MNILHKIIVGIVAFPAVVSGLMSPHATAPAQPPVVGAGVVQAQKFQLAGSGVAATATSITLQSFKLPDASTTIAITDFQGSVGYGTLEPGTSREEQISFTGVSQNGNGTATLTGVTRGLDFRGSNCTAVSANQKAHAGGAIFILSNTACYYGNFPTKSGSESISGVWTFATSGLPKTVVGTSTIFTDSAQFINKAYADALAISAGTLWVPNGNDIYKTNSGAVGIGSPTPRTHWSSALLAVEGENGSDDSDLLLRSANASSLSNSLGTTLAFLGSNGTLAAPTTTITGDVLGTIYFSGRNRTGSWSDAGRIYIEATASSSGNKIPSKMVFSLGGTTTTEPTVLTLTGVSTTIAATTTISKGLTVSGNTVFSGLSSNGVLIGGSTATTTSIAPGAIGRIIQSDGTNWVSVAGPRISHELTSTTVSVASTGASTTPIKTLTLQNASTSTLYRLRGNISSVDGVAATTTVSVAGTVVLTCATSQDLVYDIDIQMLNSTSTAFVDARATTNTGTSLSCHNATLSTLSMSSSPTSTIGVFHTAGSPRNFQSLYLTSQSF